MPPVKDLVRIAALGDLHYSRNAAVGGLQPLFSQITESADILALCGDLTDYGLPEEARALAREISTAIKVPCIAVLGNHDVESGQQDDVCRILGDAGVTTLDGDSTELLGIGFAGVKGFAGGFGRRALGPWGEDIIKKFVHEALDEALKLEASLARLRTDRLVVLLHYAPVQQTVEGEPLEIYPFLGCSRLEEPIGRFPVSAVFHGHAHHGRPEGLTAKGVPVYNVSLCLMRTVSPERPFRIVEFEVHPPAHECAPHASGERRVSGDRRSVERI